MRLPQSRRSLLGEDGFTLVELLVVIVILGVLSAVVVFSVSAVGRGADASACRAELATLERAVEVYRTTNSGPVDDAALVSARLLRASPTLYTVRAANDIVPRPGTACGTLTGITAPAPRVLVAADWTVARGTVGMTGTRIDARAVSGGAATLVLNKPGTSSDQAISTKGTLYYGAGYGLWVRATFTGASAQAGYSVQLDQAFGKLVVRHWSAGSECTVPLATAAWPAGFSPFGQHTLSAQAAGDSLTVSLDGATALTVPSLTAAAAKTSCKFPVATGTNMGIRTWNSAQAVFDETTVS